MFPLLIAAQRPTATRTDSQVSSANSSSYSFVGVAIGVASDKRLVVVSAGVSSGVSCSISAVTIGGISATQVATSGSSTTHQSLWAAIVPTGTTATIVVTSTTTANCIIGVWAVYNVNSAANDSDAATGTSTGHSISVDVPAYGVLIAATTGATGSSPTMTGISNIALSSVVESFTGVYGHSVSTANDATQALASSNGSSVNHSIAAASWS